MNKKFRIELNKEQLLLIAKCVEDCHRFMAGQMELANTTACLGTYRELRDKLAELKPLVTPELAHNEDYDWAGNGCPNRYQRLFLAQTYYIYRRIYEEVTKERAKTEKFPLGNVYLSETLRCKDSGEPIKVEVIDEV